MKIWRSWSKGIVRFPTLVPSASPLLTHNQTLSIFCINWLLKHPTILSQVCVPIHQDHATIPISNHWGLPTRVRHALPRRVGKYFSYGQRRRNRACSFSLDAISMPHPRHIVLLWWHYLPFYVCFLALLFFFGNRDSFSDGFDQAKPFSRVIAMDYVNFVMTRHASYVRFYDRHLFDFLMFSRLVFGVWCFSRSSFELRASSSSMIC